MGLVRPVEHAFHFSRTACKRGEVHFEEEEPATVSVRSSPFVVLAATRVVLDGAQIVSSSPSMLFATASATLMPSTPAERMPPA